MQKIIPHLWFDKQALEAADFYTSVFPQSQITHASMIRGTPSGDCDIVHFTLWNKAFIAINAGPLFRFNPSMSFIVNYDPLSFNGNPEEQESAAHESLEKAWQQLMDGGKALMPIGEYSFSRQYGWVQDKYGLSWQLMLTDPSGVPRPSIVPSLMFTGKTLGRAEEAIHFYRSIFKNSEQGMLVYYAEGMDPDKAGTVMFADFKLEDTWMAAMDSAHQHGFEFNESVSMMVTCEGQAEIDYYWSQLSAIPESEQCGWLKDKFGFSWQITSAEMETLMRNGSPEQLDRIARSFLSMKKIDIAAIKAAAEG
ncbi:MAG TPA: VOC family protein [Niabella sp.]|nr:VOC family protein [Niabella sp.]